MSLFGLQSKTGKGSRLVGQQEAEEKFSASPNSATVICGAKEAGKEEIELNSGSQRSFGKRSANLAPVRKVSKRFKAASFSAARWLTANQRFQFVFGPSSVT